MISPSPVDVEGPSRWDLPVEKDRLRYILLWEDKRKARYRGPRMSLSLVVVIPIFNDWQNVSPLLRRLDQAIGDQDCACDVLLVDDGSTEAFDAILSPPSYQNVRSVSILYLSGNVGH